MDLFADFFNYIIKAVAEAIGWVIDFLPDSPVQQWTNDKPANVVLGHITWFIPFPTMLLHFTVFLSALGIYYAYRIVARWLKVVRS